MRLWKKSLSLLLTLALCLSIASVGALAAEEAVEPLTEETLEEAPAEAAAPEAGEEAESTGAETSAEEPVQEDEPVEAVAEAEGPADTEAPADTEEPAGEPAETEEAEEETPATEEEPSEEPALDGASDPEPITTSTESGYSYAVVGNSGAVITMDASVTSAASSDESIAAVSADGHTVTVTRAGTAVGVVTVTIRAGGSTYAVQVPVGYTTFVFRGDSLRVYKGSGGYDVTGIDASDTEYTVTGTANEDGSTTYANGSGYSLCVELKKAGGTYVFAGASSDMAISVKKQATGPAVLLLAGLDLTSGFTSPITIKKESSSTVTITALGGHTNTLTDAAYNNADDYAANALAESAVIKGKANAKLTLNGSGTLNLVCRSKNALKVGAGGSLTIESLTLNVTSAKNGISSDNLLTINSGRITVTADADGIRTDPDSDDTVSTGDIVINGGTITIRAGSDGIQAVHDLTITGGTFDIKTLDGYTSRNFQADTMSCKGLKASTTDEYAVENATNTITITGGVFRLDCADDAVHSDGYIVITGGTFDIYTGDDGVHADTSLTLGTEGGANSAVKVNVYASYEGLEAGNIYMYSGTYYVVSSDDGVNAAGDTSSGTNDPFNPGGGPGGRPGWGGSTGGSSSNYAITIRGGDLTVFSSGDGLDANGPLYLYGGTIVVWGPSNANEALDSDGGVTFGGATVLAADAGTMHSSRYTGNYIYRGGSSGRVAAGTVITVLYNGNIMFQRTAERTVSYIWFSSPDMTSTRGWSFSTAYDLVEIEEPEPVLGDVNGDGAADAADAARILQYLVGIIGEDELDLAVADLDGDGAVTAADAARIL